MAPRIGVGVAVTLGYGRIGVSGGTVEAPDVPANALVWKGEPLRWRAEILTWR